MATLLTNRRMDPALARRIERSLAGARRVQGPRERRGARPSRAWLLPTAALAIVLGLSAALRAYEGGERDRRRDALVARAAEEQDRLGPRERAFLPRAERWIAEAAADPYPGDDRAPELTLPGELDGWLARPAVFLRAPAPELADAAAIRRAAATSRKDAFLWCLVEPPTSRDEAALVKVVRGTNFGGALVERRTANVRLLHEAEVGLGVLAESWLGRARRVEGETELVALEKELARAPIHEARLAASSDLLIVVVDELPAGFAARAADKREADTVASLVEERPHEARVLLVDLEGDRPLLRVRRKVDASAMSPTVRALHASALQSCELALSTREAALSP